MKRTLFIGAVDISDLLQYISKIITVSGKKVLLVDGTKEQFIRYATPLPSPDIDVVDFEGFDVAFGFESNSEIETFLSKNKEYEHLIVHCSNDSFIKMDDLKTFDNKYVVTSQEKVSIDKTVEIISSICSHYLKKEQEDSKIHFTKIQVNFVDTNMAEDYLETILEAFPITWSEEEYELLLDEVDYSTKISNQNEGTINIRRLSRNYKRVLQQISQQVTSLEVKDVKPAMKHVMRRSFAWGK